MLVVFSPIFVLNIKTIVRYNFGASLKGEHGKKIRFCDFFSAIIVGMDFKNSYRDAL